MILFVTQWYLWGDHEYKEKLFWWSGVYSRWIGENYSNQIVGDEIINKAGFDFILLIEDDITKFITIMKITNLFSVGNIVQVVKMCLCVTCE